MPRAQNPRRTSARQSGAKRYTGAPCGKGHAGERFTRNGLCCACQAEGQRVRRAAVADDVNEFDSLLGE
jgi:hypothetical protein